MVTDPRVKAAETQSRISENLIVRTIAKQALLRPDRIALVSQCEKVSYADLERAATQLANHLCVSGTRPGTVVATALERSPQFIVAALAVWKCGAAYLPMDLAHPSERLRFMLRDADVRCVVTEKKIT